MKLNEKITPSNSHMIRCYSRYKKEMSANCSGNCSKFKFLFEPDDALKCLICLEVAEEPWQHVDCGRLFCKECLDKHGRDKLCPNCRKEQPQYFPDNRSKREIKSLRVKCHNIEHTCPWEGTVSTVEEHVATCQFTLLPCPKKCKDNNYKIKLFMRKDLEHHLKEDCPNRDYKCKYCGVKGTYATITQVHDKVCQKKALVCTNTGCSKILQRQHISQHVKSECEHTVIACKHKIIGCGTELKRKDMPAHELDDKLHLHMAINTITTMKERIAELEKTTKETKQTITQLMKTVREKTGDIVLKQGESMKIRLTDYIKKKESKKQFSSPSFYTSQGYHMALRVCANGNANAEGTHISVYVSVVEGKYDRHLSWPVVGSVTVTLLNQLEDKAHHSMAIHLTRDHHVNSRVERSWGYYKFIPHSALGHDSIKNTQYLKDDTLYFKVEVKVGDNKPWLECAAHM